MNDQDTGRDPILEPERRWTQDHTPITEFNGPTESITGYAAEWGKAMGESINEELEKNIAVDHPPHYNNRRMEAIDIIELIIEIEKNPKVAYNMSNVLKYLLRFRDKGTEVRDLQKAQWYLNRVLMHIEQERLQDE